MTKNERTFIEMVRSAIVYMQKTESLWRKYPVLVAQYDLLVKIEQQLTQVAQDQMSKNPTSHVYNKNQQMDYLSKRFSKLSRRLVFFAKDTNNAILLNEADVTEGAFGSFSADSLRMTCSQLLTLARTYLSQTGDYQISAEELNELESELVAFSKLPQAVTSVVGDRKMATHGLKDLSNEARVVLDKLDDGLDGMIDDDNFLIGWFDARKIKGRSNGRKKETDKFEDAQIE
jgi:hypothetical protein